MTTLEILHWNDVHGRFTALARLSARARGIILPEVLEAHCRHTYG